MSKTEIAPTKHRYEGFGYCEAIRKHHFEIHIPQNDKATGVTLTERRETPATEEKTESAPTPEISIQTWRVISQKLASYLNARLKTFDDQKPPKGSFNPKGITKLEASLGKEVAVLLWALESIIPNPESHETINKIFDNWLHLSAEEKWWMYRMAYMEPANNGWKLAIHTALADAEMSNGRIHYKTGILGKPQAICERRKQIAVKTSTKPNSCSKKYAYV
jgi:hypothetical protein